MRWSVNSVLPSRGEACDWVVGQFEIKWLGADAVSWHLPRQGSRPYSCHNRCRQGCSSPCSIDRSSGTTTNGSACKRCSLRRSEFCIPGIRSLRCFLNKNANCKVKRVTRSVRCHFFILHFSFWSLVQSQGRTRPPSGRRPTRQQPEVVGK